MIKIASIVGARPQFIKAAVVSTCLRAHPDIDETLIHTGQHYSQAMSDIFFNQLEIPRPEINLGVGQGDPATQIGKMLLELDVVLRTGAFDWVLVYGDTNSTLAGAVAANKVGIPLAHVEAGLRSFNRKMPEEVNRLITDHIADLLFTPTETADGNLQNENIPAERIARVGDVMYDSVLYYREKAGSHSSILETLGLKPKDYLLCSAHRAENTDKKSNLEAILRGVALISKEIPVIFPLHPRTQAAMAIHQLDDLLPSSVRLIEPVGYIDMLQLEGNARLIVTDSGGVQKEAYFLGVPCLTLRHETEWLELVRSGWNTLALPQNSEGVAQAIRNALAKPKPALTTANLFGDGHAAEKILDVLLKTQQ